MKFDKNAYKLKVLTCLNWKCLQFMLWQPFELNAQILVDDWTHLDWCLCHQITIFNINYSNYGMTQPSEKSAQGIHVGNLCILDIILKMNLKLINKIYRSTTCKMSKECCWRCNLAKRERHWTERFLTFLQLNNRRIKLLFEYFWNWMYIFIFWKEYGGWWRSVYQYGCLDLRYTTFG